MATTTPGMSRLSLWIPIFHLFRRCKDRHHSRPEQRNRRSSRCYRSRSQQQQERNRDQEQRLFLPTQLISYQTNVDNGLMGFYDEENDIIWT